MRKSILFLILAFGLFFQSCLESVVLEQASDSSSTVGGITIQLTVPSGVNSSVPTKTGTESGNAEENTINALYIWLYAKQGNNWVAINEDPYEEQNPVFDGDEYSISIESPGVTNDYLVTAVAAGEFWAVVYANSETVPTAIDSEADFWSDDNGDTEVLNPLFFSGSAKFTGDQSEGYTANVDLTRQVAKLQVKVGVDEDVFPTGLYIDLESVSVVVSGMVDNSTIVLDSTGPDPDNASHNSQASFSGISPREAIHNGTVTDHNVLRYDATSTELTSSTVVDYLYMHPKAAGTDESEAITVQLTMDVKDPIAKTTTQVTTDAIPITITDALGTVSYSTSNNTIYTLEVTVKSLNDGNATYDSTISVIKWEGDTDWEDASEDVDVKWGEIVIDRTEVVVLTGTLNSYTFHNIITVSTDATYGEYKMELVAGLDDDADRNLGLYYIWVNTWDPSTWSNFPITLASGASYTVQISAAESFAACYLKISPSSENGLTRYIPVGIVDDGTIMDYELTYYSTVTWPEGYSSGDDEESSGEEGTGGESTGGESTGGESAGGEGTGTGGENTGE